MTLAASSGNRIWSEDDGHESYVWGGPSAVDQLRHMWNDLRLDGTVIASLFGVPRGTILGKIWRLRKQGMQFDARPPVAGGIQRRKQQQVLESLGVPVRSSGAISPRKRPQATQPAAPRRMSPMAVEALDEQDEQHEARGPRVRLPSYSPERIAARRAVELIRDEATLYRTDMVRCVCGRPGQPHCAKHAAVVARVLG